MVLIPSGNQLSIWLLVSYPKLTRTQSNWEDPPCWSPPQRSCYSFNFVQISSHIYTAILGYVWWSTSDGWSMLNSVFHRNWSVRVCPILWSHFPDPLSELQAFSLLDRAQYYTIASTYVSMSIWNPLLHARQPYHLGQTPPSSTWAWRATCGWHLNL